MAAEIPYWMASRSIRLGLNGVGGPKDEKGALFGLYLQHRRDLVIAGSNPFCGCNEISRE
jgi:hypothetical protein